MPPRKRARAPDDSTARGRKQQRVSTRARARIDVGVADVTAQNAIQSPFLRLPGELRIAIWQLLFGDQLVYFDRKRGGSGLAFMIWHDNWTRRRGQFPQLVCKQYWNETTSIFFSTSTFRTNGFEALHGLALDPSLQELVPRIRRLEIDSFLGSRIRTKMASTLTPSILARFEGLEGFKWKFGYNQSNEYWFKVTDVMSDARWKRAKVPTIVRAMQQHKLREDLTSVEFYTWPTDSSIADPRTALSNMIRGHLLEHVPRRTSMRGKQGPCDQIGLGEGRNQRD
ncbi:hypothetical protein EJ07DRAFT_155764 [Lizonia empirigonia]|nr:hypothetical protein EJ07DRAFT_155764 [Lizonia empirigonia]